MRYSEPDLSVQCHLQAGSNEVRSAQAERWLAGNEPLENELAEWQQAEKWLAGNEQVGSELAERQQVQCEWDSKLSRSDTPLEEASRYWL